MTAPTGTNGGAGDPSTTASDPSGTGTAAQPGSTGASASPDYLTRVRAGGDFAASEVTKFQSDRDKAEANVKKIQEWMGPLEQYRDAFTGQQMIDHLSAYNRILENPALKQAVTGYLQTGEVQLPGATSSDGSDDDEYQTPEQQEIQGLRAKLASLEGRVVSQESGAGAQALQTHLESFFADYPLPPDVVERVKGKLTQQVRAWSTQGEVGRKALEAVQNPAHGKAQVSAMALPMLSFDEQTAAIEQRALRKSKGLRGLATGGPSTGASSGTEPPPRFKSALEALEWAQAHPESHDSY